MACPYCITLRRVAQLWFYPLCNARRWPVVYLYPGRADSDRAIYPRPTTKLTVNFGPPCCRAATSLSKSPCRKRLFLTLELSLTSVNHGYVEFGYNPDKSGSCNLDVVCSAGDGFPQVDAWREEIRSRWLAISLGGSLFCSGGLINNTAQDYKPFFLTAAHCNINSGNAASLVAYWNYQNSTCRAPNSAASGQSGNGSLTAVSNRIFFPRSPRRLRQI